MKAWKEILHRFQRRTLNSSVQFSKQVDLKIIKIKFRAGCRTGSVVVCRAAGDAFELGDDSKEIAIGRRVEIWRSSHTNLICFLFPFSFPICLLIWTLHREKWESKNPAKISYLLKTYLGLRDSKMYWLGKQALDSKV